MKVGDMVKWVGHEDWSLGGRGIIVGAGGNKIRVAWLDDIEEFGWGEVMDTRATWYDTEDLQENIELVVEVQ